MAGNCLKLAAESGVLRAEDEFVEKERRLRGVYGVEAVLAGVTGDRYKVF